MLSSSCLSLLFSLFAFVAALRYDPQFVDYNLNQNQEATYPAAYSGEWENHTFNPSPENWRFPFYTIAIDRYVDGDPTNNEANGTVFEHDWMSNQFRFGGDVRGLMGSLDYVQGMGIKAIYLTGSPFINMPWSSDGYGPLDFTLLDAHHGIIDDWRALITEIHARNMYVVLDNTMATMGDLIGFQDYLNTSTPFSWSEHNYVWKQDRRYHDFQPGDAQNSSCVYPEFYLSTGLAAGTDITSQEAGCRASEFDQYGDTTNTGSYPTWQTQLSKFAGVQDRLRAWQSDVLEKINVMSCMQISMFDIDGFRIDKALQTTVDVLAEFSTYQRQCAKKYGKDNFLVVGETIGAEAFTALYLGRGRQPDQAVSNTTAALLASNTSESSGYMREWGNGALDAAGFDYIIYGAMTRFLGLDGDFGFDGVDFGSLWDRILELYDMVNSNTGVFDPRQFYGMTNQDVFRWPALAQGIERQILGLFITTLGMPGIPLTFWGEEQAFNILDSTAADYLYGRQPMTSSRAWQLHGCYHVGADSYVNMPFNSSTYACHDDTVSLDHRDPSHPVRNILKRMYELRTQYPTLNDGYTLNTLSNKTHDIYLPGSDGVASPTGIWSLYRGRADSIQDFNGTGQGNQGVWFIYSNDNQTVDYNFDCNSSTEALISAFPANATVKNLFYPYEEITLESSVVTLGIESSSELNGCLSNITMEPFAYKAFVPVGAWETPAPTITRLSPSHDQRIQSSVALGETTSVPIEIQFSRMMDCDSVKSSLQINSTAYGGVAAALNQSSVVCQNITADPPSFAGAVGASWSFSATLVNVTDGIHVVTIDNATATDASFTNARDIFMFRLGQPDNPMVFPLSANYTTGVFQENADTGDLYVVHTAPGADLWRYSTNWGSSWSNWAQYNGSNTTITPQAWSGTDAQKWTGEHVILNYWSDKTGSSDHIQHADLNRGTLPSRRWPHVFMMGSWNQYGYDDGLKNGMSLKENGLWEFNLMAEWPQHIMLNVWGMNPDGAPDKSKAFGDVDGDGVLDWMPPDSLAYNEINITSAPPMPYLGYRVLANDGNYNYTLEPAGSVWHQVILGVLIGILPLITGIIGVILYKRSFYQVKFNTIGVGEKRSLTGTLQNLLSTSGPPSVSSQSPTLDEKSGAMAMDRLNAALAADAGSPNRRTVLIATMEYEIEDWNIKVKIGGLGVMASLMGKNLGHQDLIWVVPCVGGIDYPVDTPGEVMTVSILGNVYEIEVQYHKVRNITFVLLDSPLFRKQTKAEPYPARMDDLESAVFYSAWNTCIAKALKRFPVDLYHINDYHGALAPLHLLPRTIPVCLSLHNAEFQGLWPLRTKKEMDEICRIFNLSEEIVQKYVQFGEVFNLLHAAASYLRVHQKGFGAVGVSKKYGARAFARYPIFWGLKNIGALPNPDPADTGEWNRNAAKIEAKAVEVDESSKLARQNLRTQAQEWAGLKVDPTAELFVFVGRWSQQKGVDLIADVFFSVLEENPNVQLICVGPVIDLYGKFAALKLAKMMEMYPERVFSKPEFTALPPYIFSGAEFALIPSRDEPFGLVAVEFGRKGALGVGSRVGGLGQMPGWWYTIESTTTKHLIKQFKSAIQSALASKEEVRALMRFRSGLQRFPVAEWIEDLDTLQSTSIRVHEKQASGSSSIFRFTSSRTNSTASSPTSTRPNTAPNSRPGTRPQSRVASPFQSPMQSRAPSPIREDDDDAVQYDGTPRTDTPVSARTPLGMKRSFATKTSTPTISRDNSYQDLASIANRTSLSDVTSIPRNSSGKDLAFIKKSGSSKDLSSASRNVSFKDMRLITRPHAVQEDNESICGSINMPSRAHTPSRFDIYRAAETPASTAPPSLYEESINDPFTPPYHSTKSKSVLSLQSVVGEQKDFNLQKTDPFFTDTTGTYYHNFEKILDGVNSKNSIDKYCIEKYLEKSEREWFGKRHNVKLGLSAPASSKSSIHKPFQPLVRTHSRGAVTESEFMDSDLEQFSLGHDFVPAKGIRKFLQRKLGNWQLYSLILALGQIIAANSYQINLIAGSNGESALKLYIVATIYLISSIAWWLIYRRLRAVYVLCLPFAFYGAAFFMLGMGPYTSNLLSRGWIYNVATGFYAVASASGSFFFALNFGSEGGAPVKTWVFRACSIQGTQQIYVIALWYWGDSLTDFINNGGSTSTLITNSPRITAIMVPIAVLLWAIGVLLFFGLPTFYRQQPGQVPSFYTSLLRRKIVLWFFVMVILQNYWLSAPYGRNWRYLFSSSLAPVWAIWVVIILFFILIWAGLLAFLSRLTRQHSWLLPIFAISLGAPRWCQMLWGTSNIGLYIPWGSPTFGAVLGRALWSWLGILDSIQGIGFGMILLQTLTRVHIACTLVLAQVIGSIATIAARASAPDNVGPGDVFPDFSFGFWEPLKLHWLWIGLLCQLLICVGFFAFFRKEQLSKP